jgi:high affinity Mn2+ porin
MEVLLVVLLVAWSPGVRAEDTSAALFLWPPFLETPAPAWWPQFLGAQVTVIPQHLFPFHSPYTGPNSLVATGDTQVTHTYGSYFGAQITRNLQGYVDVEMARGGAVGNAFGLGGLTNGDVIRAGTVNLGKGPYVARAFVRVVIPLAAAREPVERDVDQLPGTEPVRRLEVKAGILATTDDFDRNRYANNPRTAFMNWSFMFNTAWDYAADTRGYTRGLMLGWITPTWAVRLGSYQMPTFANGNVLDNDLLRARGDNLELTLQPPAWGTVVRLLAFANHARMGRYDEAVAQARATGTTPDIVADDRPGRVKYGVALNVEQPLADGGETGLFLRLGWNKGHTETFAYTEVDNLFSGGLQVSGVHWGRGADRLGLAVASGGLADPHRRYLAAGGKGFLLGDGRLTYGRENIVEGYYRVQVGRYVQLSPDVQYIDHPGFNKDRGPAWVIGLRLRVSVGGPPVPGL